MTSRAGTEDDETLLDDLTRIARRGAFDRDLPAMLQEAERRKEPLGLVMVDIDHFKSVNDRHGHPVGDEVLRGVSQALAQVVRARGQCYRYGGEEVALLLPNHSPDESAAVAERARRAIERTPMASPRVEVTASFGVASYPEHATDADVLVKKADEALYDAKNRGRNLVRVSGEPPPPQPGPREVAKRAPEPGGLTNHQRTKIRSDYIRNGIAFCPHDGAPLEILEDREMGHALGVIGHCPDCGLSMHEPGPPVR